MRPTCKRNLDIVSSQCMLFSPPCDECSENDILHRGEAILKVGVGLGSYRGPKAYRIEGFGRYIESPAEPFPDPSSRYRLHHPIDNKNEYV
jgi:hypothetical protein